MNIRTKLQEILAENQSTAQKTFQDGNLKILEAVASEMAAVLSNGGTIFLCGNGGSAADAQHIAAEFIGRFKKERRSFPAIALTTDTSILTSLANDYSYDIIFARQLEGLARPGDLLVAISTSGNSRNVLEAVKKAKEIGLRTVAFTGEKGGTLSGMTDIVFKSASNHTSHIQETHITALHAVSEIVEEIVASQSHASKS